MKVKKYQIWTCWIHVQGILESKGVRVIFQKKGRKNVKKGKNKRKNIWSFGQKYTKYEKILKKGSWLRVIIACNKLLEKALMCHNTCVTK